MRPAHVADDGVPDAVFLSWLKKKTANTRILAASGFISTPPGEPDASVRFSQKQTTTLACAGATHAGDGAGLEHTGVLSGAQQ